MVDAMTMTEIGSMDLAMIAIINYFLHMVTHITIEKQKPYVVWIYGDAGARNGAFEISEEFDDLASARAYVSAESAKIIKQNKHSVVRRVEKI